MTRKYTHNIIIIINLMGYLNDYCGNDFIDVPKLLDELKTNNLILITSRNIGKSYSTYMHVMKNWVNTGREFVIVRLSKEELMQSDIINTFYYIINKLGLVDLLVRLDGIYYKKNKIATFIYFSGATNSKSQGSLNNVEYIVFDEFINDTIPINKWMIKWADVYKTFQRNNIIKCIFLGNKNSTLESDLMAEYGIEFNLTNKQNQVIRNDTNDIVGVCISYTIKSLSQTQFERTFINTPVETFSKGLSVSSCLIKTVYSWTYNSVCDSFEPRFVLKFQDNFFLFGFWNKDNKKVLYVKEMFSREDVNVPYYFILARDVEFGLIDIKTEGLRNDFSVVYDWAKVGVYFSSVFVKTIFKAIISLISTFIKL